MPSEISWPARYLYLEELWRGRDRIIVDPQLEFGVGSGELAPHERLLARLRARVVGSRGENVLWFHAERDDVRSRALARNAADHSDRRTPSQRPIQFALIDAAASIARDARWDCAFVEVSQALARPQGDGSRILALLDALGPLDTRRQSLVLHVAADARGADTYGDFVSLLEDRYGDVPGGVFVCGLARSYALQLFEVGAFGGVHRDAESVDHSAIEFDNRLADETPDIVAYVARVGQPMADGLCVVELPWPLHASEQPLAPEEAGLPSSSGIQNSAASARQLSSDPSTPAPALPSPQSASGEDPWLKLPVEADADSSGASLVEGLAEARRGLAKAAEELEEARDRARRAERRRDELEARVLDLERGEEALRVEAETLRSRVSELADELDDLRDPPDLSGPGGDRDSTPTTPGPAGPESAVEASAREQSLSWRVEELEQKLHRLRVRPVDEVESQLAAAKSKVDDLERALARAPRPASADENSSQWHSDSAGALASTAGADVSDGGGFADPRASLRTLRGELTAVAERFQRGDLPPGQFHGELLRLLDQLSSADVPS